MIKFIFTIPIFFILVSCGGSGKLSEGRTNQIATEMKLVIDRMIKDLETDDIKSFLFKSFRAEYIDSVGGIDAAISQFDSLEKETILIALQAAKNIEPEAFQYEIKDKNYHESMLIIVRYDDYNYPFRYTITRNSDSVIDGSVYTYKSSSGVQRPLYFNKYMNKWYINNKKWFDIVE